jgi:hypothetical protein
MIFASRQRARTRAADAPLAEGGEAESFDFSAGRRAELAIARAKAREQMNTKQSHSKRVRDCTYETEKAEVLPVTTEVTLGGEGLKNLIFKVKINEN